jgi:hypothetical protein
MSVVCFPKGLFSLLSTFTKVKYHRIDDRQLKTNDESDRPPFLLVYTLSATVAEYLSVFMNKCREMAPSGSNCRQWSCLSTTKGRLHSDYCKAIKMTAF